MLYDLPDEVLYITTKYLQAMDRSSVTRLSLVSRTIRPVCLRVMFETIYMNPELSIPEAYELPVMFDAAREDADHLRRYVRTMVLEGSPSHETQDQTVSLLSKVIPKMSGLSTIRCLESIIGIWHDLYELLCSTPGITRLEIIASAWTDLASSRNMRLSSIKHLVYGQANSPPHEYRDDLMFETKTLSMFFLFHHDHLVSMQIPSELALYSLLGSVSWPNLRSVILHGYAPIDPIASEIGLFFAAAPSLRFLKMNIARTRTINDYTIFGAGTGRENKNTNTNIDVPSSFLSRLHTFSMSDPNPKDEVFRLLPSTLHSLELLSYPRPTKFNITEDLPQPPIPCSEMVRILAKSAILGLNTLRLSIGGPFDRAFIDALVLYYPSLEVLELQVLKQQDVRIDARENITTLAEGLAPLSHLRELRLQQLVYKKLPGDLPDPPLALGVRAAPDDMDIWTSPFYNVALTISNSVRSIRKITFLGGYTCPEICRVELREGEVLTFWQETPPVAIWPETAVAPSSEEQL